MTCQGPDATTCSVRSSNVRGAAMSACGRSPTVSIVADATPNRVTSRRSSTASTHARPPRTSCFATRCRMVVPASCAPMSATSARRAVSGFPTITRCAAARPSAAAARRRVATWPAAPHRTSTDVRADVARFRLEGAEVNYDDVSPYAGYRSALGEQASAFLSSVYAWMCAGLLITAATAWTVAGSPTAIQAIATSRALFWGLVIAQFGIVFVLSARVQQLAASTAALLFVAYSAITGATLSFVLLVYTGESVATTFVVTAGMFGALAFYGTTTKRDLGGVGQFLFMGLIGLVLASFVGLFVHSDGFQFLLSFVGVIVFAGLAAYDAQWLKVMALQAATGR